MMNIHFYYFIICVLLARVYSQWNDERYTTKKTLLYVVLPETVLLFPLYSLDNIWVYAVLLLFYHTFVILIERNNTNTYLKRIVEIVVIVLVAGFAFGTVLKGYAFNPVSKKILLWIIDYNALFQGLTIPAVKKMIVYLFFILFLVNEFNHIIRYILSRLKIEPSIEENRVRIIDTEELKRGKVIGVIERIMFFLFVVSGNYASIAFILAAKGFTRFKELDNKNFAEYVLIGTLLSGSLSIFWALYAVQVII